MDLIKKEKQQGTPRKVLWCGPPLVDGRSRVSRSCGQGCSEVQRGQYYYGNEPTVQSCARTFSKNYGGGEFNYIQNWGHPEAINVKFDSIFRGAATVVLLQCAVANEGKNSAQRRLSIRRVGT